MFDKVKTKKWKGFSYDLRKFTLIPVALLCIGLSSLLLKVHSANPSLMQFFWAPSTKYIPSLLMLLEINFLNDYPKCPIVLWTVRGHQTVL